MRNDLFGQLSEIPGLELTDISSEALYDLVLFGNEGFNNIYKSIVEIAILFIFFYLKAGMKPGFPLVEVAWGLPPAHC